MKRIAFFMLVYLANLSLFAQNDFSAVSTKEITEFKAKLKNKNIQLNTLSAHFVQTKTMTVLKKPAITKGFMYVKQNNKFRWEYTNNPKFIFAQNGNKIYTQTGENIQIITDNSVKLYEEISKLVQQSIHGNILENTKDFTAIFEQNNRYIKIILTPKQRGMKRFISNITLFIDKQTMLASKFNMLEPNGDSTMIEFENIKTNVPIDDQLFILKK